MIELKNYSTYSLEHGFLSLDEIIESDSAKENKVAVLTEDSTLISSIEFIEKCVKKGIKPIIGLTVHLGHEDKDAGTVTLYAKNREGFQSLVNIVNAINKTKNEDRLVTVSDVFDNKNNLIAVIGGKNSILEQPILDRDDAYADEMLDNFKATFGKDLFLEVQNYGDDKNELINRKIKQLSENYDVPYIATNDNRFLKKGHYKLFLQKSKNVRKMKSIFNPEEHTNINQYIATPEQNQEKFKNYPEAIAANQSFVNNFELFRLVKDEPYIPSYEKTLREVLREKYVSFIKEKSPEKVNDYKLRIQEELGIIETLGFENYFLIFDDIAKNNPEANLALRGSSISSLVTHILGLSAIDPVENGLLFERFLNKGRGQRQELPDIDLETDNVKHILAYLNTRYGSNNMATISKTDGVQSKSQIELAFNTIKDDILSNPLDDNGTPRILPEKEFNQIVGFIEERPTTAKLPLSEELQVNYRLANYVKGNMDANKLVKMALLFENQVMNISRSPASYVITPLDVKNIFSKYSSKDGEGFSYNVLEIEKANIEKVGLVKLDILKNVYLEKINKTLDKLNINLDTDDKYQAKEVFDLLNQGYTVTINQLLKPYQAKFCKDVGISDINDIVNILALQRPGVPRQEKEKFIEAKRKGYNGPAILEPILKDTYGIIIFDEQIMNIVKKVGQFSPEDADAFRSAIKKSKMDTISEMKVNFMKGASNQGVSEDLAESIFKDLENRAGKYSFSKSHALAYAHLIYQQTWIKANYPAEYFEFFVDRKQKEDYTKELVERGIKILPLDINRSLSVYKTRTASETQQKGIDFSLSALLPDSEDFTKLIVNERIANGRYKNIYDFVERVLPKYAGISVFSSKWNEEHKIKLNFTSKVEALIRIGAFDRIMPNELNNDILLGREVLKDSLNNAISLVLKPYARDDFEYIVPEKRPKEEQFIREEKNFYGGISFMEHHLYAKKSNEKKYKPGMN